MSSVKTRKLDISTILAVVRAQNSTGSIDSWTFNQSTEDIYNNNSGRVAINKKIADYTLDVSGNFKANSIIDKNNSSGVAGQFLSTTGDELEWKAGSDTATNITGGTAGQILYQSAAGTTAKLSTGTSGQLLQSQGASAPIWITPFGSAVIRELTLSTSNSPITFTIGAKSTRQLTNLQFNSLGITLSGTPNNTFTIPTAGTYIFRARALYAFTRLTTVAGQPSVVGSQLFLHYQNALPSPLPAFIIGESSKSSFGETSIPFNNSMNYVADMVGIGTVGNNAVMSLEQQVNNLQGSTNSANGGQFVNVAGQNSIYATIEIQRIA
jgi:hypothetical protein